jgi:IS5 family transposase
MLRVAGYIAMSGQIVDATHIAAPRQRNTGDEKNAIVRGFSTRRIPRAAYRSAANEEFLAKSSWQRTAS